MYVNLLLPSRIEGNHETKSVSGGGDDEDGDKSLTNMVHIHIIYCFTSKNKHSQS